MIKRAVFFAIMTLSSVLLAIGSSGILVTIWGLAAIAWGVQCAIELQDYFNNNHPHTPKFS